jgi:hypothetical protein
LFGMNKPLSDDEIFRFRENLFSNLRLELDQLKACQSNSVFWGIAGSTAVITIIGASNLNTPELACFFLIPLLIVCPAWMIFFDKSRTIFRLTGFLRLQEKLAVKNSRNCVIGWESALEKFWAKQDEFQTNPHFIKDENDAIETLSKSRKRISSHVYLWMVYFVFFLMAILTFALCARQIGNTEVFLFILLGGLYLNLFFFVNFKKAVMPVFTPETVSEKFVGVLFKIYDMVVELSDEIVEGISSVFIELFSIKQKEKSPPSKKSGFDKSFRGFLDDLIFSQKIFGIVNILFFSLLAFYHFRYDPQIDSYRTTLISMAIFTAFLTFFTIVFQITLYIFLNLIRGRYTINAYESRWQNVLS